MNPSNTHSKFDVCLLLTSDPSQTKPHREWLTTHGEKLLKCFKCSSNTSEAEKALNVESKENRYDERERGTLGLRRFSLFFLQRPRRSWNEEGGMLHNRLRISMRSVLKNVTQKTLNSASSPHCVSTISRDGIVFHSPFSPFSSRSRNFVPWSI